MAYVYEPGFFGMQKLCMNKRKVLTVHLIYIQPVLLIEDELVRSDKFYFSSTPLSMLTKICIELYLGVRESGIRMRTGP